MNGNFDFKRCSDCGNKLIFVKKIGFDMAVSRGYTRILFDIYKCPKCDENIALDRLYEDIKNYLCNEWSKKNYGRKEKEESI